MWFSNLNPHETKYDLSVLCDKVLKRKIQQAPKHNNKVLKKNRKKI